MSDAGTKVWVCEEGHVDDHYYTRDEPCQPELCSRCGGECQHWSLDRLAREYVERLRINVGLVAENTKLKRRLEDEGK